MFAVLIESFGAWRKRSNWYETEDEVLAGLSSFLKANKGREFNVKLIEGDGKSKNGLGF